jgi:large subunit ribosomal protein L21
MYAIIEDSGTQIKVSEGDVVKVAIRELPAGAVTLTFDKILLVSANAEGKDDLKIGQPWVDGAKVTADILAEDKTPRVPVVKFRNRTNYTRRKGHRQSYLKVKITSIKA